ncbi:deaminated glutathione amidase [Hetaerina americana]|uniref:deaminated glutathione amidase n=1 Tax=Hetaerina americana TaxID=62018 RepID=UPI003A7F338F
MNTYVCRIIPNHNLRFLFKSFTKSMASISNRLMIAVCQITSKSDKEENFKCCSNLIRKAAEDNAKVVFLPEACDYLGRSTQEILALAEPLDGPTISRYKELASHHNIWISLGGVHEKDGDRMVSNSHVIINGDGDIAGVYRKVHLFDVEIPEKKLYLKESKYVNKGMEIAPPVCSPIGNIGMGICYDLRFPAFSQKLTKMGAEVLTYPSAFTTTTGPDHWEILLRARAIENQCYVIAAAQVGTHFVGRSSYGHSMVVDPWGRIVAESTTDEVGVIMADLDMSHLARVRRNMPVINHQREDLYTSPGPCTTLPLISGCQYQFGSISLKESVIFLRTLLTIAFVNKKCVLPGHVLVAPIRQVKRLEGLTEEEAADFFRVIRMVEKGMEKTFNTSSSTVSIQDGECAGQTIFQVHAHIIPRKMHDLEENDEIYKLLEGHESNTNIRERTNEEMENEATQLRQLFSQPP